MAEKKEKFQVYYDSEEDKRDCKCEKVANMKELTLEKYFDFLSNFVEKKADNLNCFINFDQKHNCISLSVGNSNDEGSYVDVGENKKNEVLEIEVKTKVDTSEVDVALEKIEKLTGSEINSVERLKECAFELASECQANDIDGFGIICKYGFKEEYERWLEE